MRSTGKQTDSLRPISNRPRLASGQLHFIWTFSFSLIYSILYQTVVTVTGRPVHGLSGRVELMHSGVCNMNTT